MNKDIKVIKQKMKPILKSYKVIRAGIFGSYARGEQKRNSDIDILIEIGDKADLIEVIKLKYHLEKKIKKKIDLVEYDSIKKALRKNILKEEIPIAL